MSEEEPADTPDGEMEDPADTTHESGIGWLDRSRSLLQGLAYGGAMIVFLLLCIQTIRPPGAVISWRPVHWSAWILLVIVAGLLGLICQVIWMYLASLGRQRKPPSRKR